VIVEKAGYQAAGQVDVIARSESDVAISLSVTKISNRRDCFA
jgi:hypothetical protein